MQTATPLHSIDALTAPVDDAGRHPAYGELIFFQYAQRAEPQLEKLEQLYGRAKSKPVADALWAGFVALSAQVRGDVQEVRSRGQLPLYWQGSAVLRAAK